MIKRSLVQNILLFFKYKISYLKNYFPYMLVHKPLCEKYRQDSLFLFNKIFICRSCFYLYLGMLFSIIFKTIVGSNAAINLQNSIILFGIIAILSYPKIYALYSRIFRDIMRFLAGFSAVLLVICMFQHNIMYLLILIYFLFVIKNYYNKIRGQRDLCNDCKEQYGHKSCSGYKSQTEAMLRIEEEVSNYIMQIKERG